MPHPSNQTRTTGTQRCVGCGLEWLCPECGQPEAEPEPYVVCGGPPPKDQVRKNRPPCADCGVNEADDCFTVCGPCWDKAHPKDDVECVMCGTRGPGVGFAHECRHADATTLAELAAARAEVEKLSTALNEWSSDCHENHTSCERAELAEAEVEKLRAELATERKVADEQMTAAHDAIAENDPLRAVADAAKVLREYLGPLTLTCPECGKGTDDVTIQNRHSHGVCHESLIGPDFTPQLRALHTALDNLDATPSQRHMANRDEVCTTPNGRTDGHAAYVETNAAGEMRCTFCKRPVYSEPNAGRAHRKEGE